MKETKNKEEFIETMLEIVEESLNTQELKRNVDIVNEIVELAEDYYDI